MANTRLEIGSNENVGYFTDIPVNILFQISDVRTPDRRKGTYSRTINLPGSQSNNILFENIFEANISLQTFNPHLKTAAKYYVDELVMFKGYAQLLKINVDETTKKVTYEVSLIGEINTLFTDIANRYLTDLDFSAYDHDLSYAQISGSWGASGSGFVYPNINWGTSKNNLSTWTPLDFRACFFVREYLDKIFTDAGYTWTSSFLDSPLFQKLIIPSNKPAVLDQSALNDGKFLAVANGSQVQTITFTGSPASNIQYSTNALNDVSFQSETYDTGAIFATPTFTVPVTAKYNVTAKLGLNLVIKRLAVDQSANLTPNAGNIQCIIWNTTTSSIAGVGVLGFADFSLANGNSNNIGVTLNNIQLTAGHAYKVRIKNESLSFGFTGATAPASDWTMETTILSGSSFAAEFSSTAPYEGATVPGNSLIPENIKQGDFIASIIRMFNLYFMVDKTNPRNYIIEPREDFYSTDFIDWTYKHDDNSLTDVIPLGELDSRDYRFTYKPDGDHYNKLYSDYYKNSDSSPQVYGTHELSITNDFLRNETVTDVIFSATPYSIDTSSDMVVPTIIKMDNNTVADMGSSNIRILYYGGSIALPGLKWTFVYNNGASSVVYNNLLAAGHTDNPYAPTLDINWGLPVKVYYTYPNLYWTTNNLYNTYYSRQFNQITDKNSKVVITDFYLTPIDINTFDFRVPVFWKDAYYLVNKLDYNPLVRGVTRVELLKLTNFDAFTPTTYAYGGGLGDGNNTWEKIKNDNVTSGPNNFNESQSSAIIGGNDNFIAQAANSCTLINCSQVVITDAENFTGSNIVGPMAIDSSYSNTKLDGSEIPVNISSDTDITREYHGKELRVDCSGGDVTLTWDIYNQNLLSIVIIRVDSSANSLYFDSTLTYGTESFIGNAFPYNTGAAQYDVIPTRVLSDKLYINR